MRLWLEGGRVIDPARGEDAVRDVFVEDGRIVGSPGGDPGALRDAGWARIDCRGRVVAPGFVDLHAALVSADDVTAAIAGGFTTVVLSPSHPIVLDGPADLRMRRQELADPRCAVEAAGALTRGLEGRELGEMGRLLEAGCVVLSQGAVGLSDAAVLRHALEYAGRFDATVFVRPTEVALEAGGVVREGPRALWLGLPGVPAEAEEIGVYRLAALSRLAGCRVHLTHLSTARGVEALRQVRRAGGSLTASTTAHHLVLGDEVVERTAYAPEARFHPPLGDAADRAALAGAVADGVIDAVASDHLPIPRHEREGEFQVAPAGNVGLATALSLVLEAVGDARVAVRALVSGPARILGRPPPGLAPGAPADVVVFDPAERWSIGADTPLGSQRNTVLGDRALIGRVRTVLRAGHVVVDEAAPVVPT